jgi:4-diphosphocytidyl-2-C-methyl-D-erythritol kinase
LLNKLQIMQAFAPAKINLSFKIKGRREDGFHEIETLMAPISLTDCLTIERGEIPAGVRFTSDDPSLPTGEENLVVRAVRLFFREATQIDAGVEINLVKRIPHGAGLGGGSSDAATTLLALNQLFAAGLDRKALVELAAQIGSDVPFFILGSAATCRGRGEIVEPANLPARFHLLLVKPDFGVPTPWAYSRWKDSRGLPDVSAAEQEFSGVRFVNDLERPVFEKFVLLGYLKNWLRAQPEVGAALLSGSGSTVFAVLRDGADAKQLEKRIRVGIDPKMWIQACETV